MYLIFFFIIFNIFTNCVFLILIKLTFKAHFESKINTLWNFKIILKCYLKKEECLNPLYISIYLSLFLNYNSFFITSILVSFIYLVFIIC